MSLLRQEKRFVLVSSYISQYSD